MHWVLCKIHGLSRKCQHFLIFQTNTIVLTITVGLSFIWNELVLLLPKTGPENPCKAAGSLQENKALY